MRPNEEQFSAAVRTALGEVLCLEQKEEQELFAIYDAKGLSFDLQVDGAVDSLDMLDVAYSVDKQLGVRIGLEELKLEHTPMTVKNLLASIPDTRA